MGLKAEKAAAPPQQVYKTFRNSPVPSSLRRVLQVMYCVPGNVQAPQINGDQS